MMTKFIFGIMICLYYGSYHQNHYKFNSNMVCNAQQTSIQQQHQQQKQHRRQKHQSRQEQHDEQLQQSFDDRLQNITYHDIIANDYHDNHSNITKHRILLFKSKDKKKDKNKNINNANKTKKIVTKKALSVVEYTKSLPDAMKRKNKKKHRVSELAVVHIGPHKTSTTSIQGFAKEFMDELHKDGYAIPGDWSERNTINMIELTNCFLPTFTTIKDEERRNHRRSLQFSSTYCDSKILNDIPTIASLGYNLFLTAESFSYLAINLDKVIEVLKPWKHVKVIAYYRRFYDWLHSQWNQDHKEIHPSIRPSFNDYITQLHKLGTEEIMGYQKAYRNNYITACIPRWKNIYPDIDVYNMHDMKVKKATITFYCDALPNATNTCFAIEKKLRLKPEARENPSHKYVYTDLAYVAGKERMNLIPKSSKYYDMSIKELGIVIQNYHEKIMGRSMYSFDYMICPNDNVLNELLQKTLDTELEYFPDFYNTHGKQEIIEQFDKEKTSKLCHVNATAVLLYDNEWKSYFQSLS